MAESRLEGYRRMRDFAATPEPSGEPLPPPAPGDRPRFVIQQHDATRLHWDLRLEHDGVLVSWALPRGVPWTPAEDRLAVHTEDHPLAYLDFHGEIPAGQYGAGTMVVWDTGHYDVVAFDEPRKVVIRLGGTRVQGTYALFRTRSEREWMIHRVDPPQDPDRRPLPTDLRPTHPTRACLPDDPGVWAFEIAWSGCRVLATNDAGHVDLRDGQGRDVGAALPELRRLGRHLAAVECVLDGVVVPVDRGGQPLVDDERVERRLAADTDSRARRLAEDVPVALLLVDLLWLEGHPVTHLPLEERRSLLDGLELAGPRWRTERYHVGDGQALLDAARARSLAGLLAKRLGSPYRPGEVSEDWRYVAT